MDSIEKAMQTVLPQLDEAKLQTLVNELVTNIGVEGPDDLEFIKEDDIKHLLTPIQCRKIIHSFKGGEITGALVYLLSCSNKSITKFISNHLIIVLLKITYNKSKF